MAPKADDPGHPVLLVRLKTLKTDHPRRAALVQQELARREAPPRDYVAELGARARSNPILAFLIVLVVLLAAIATFKENLCELVPSSSPSDLCG